MNLIVGTGLIAEEYIKIMINMNKRIEVIGNTKIKCESLSKKYNIKCHDGGIEKFQFIKEQYENIIIATPIELLYKHLNIVLDNCKTLQNILIEKPGCLNNHEFNKIINLKNKVNKNCNIYIAYNRRFYDSLNICKEIIKENKIINAELEINEFNMDKIIESKSSEILQNWFNCMTTHVVDMFFHIIGNPVDLICNNEGINSLEWHKRCSIYSGEGMTNNNIPFKYSGNWNNNGKWKIKLYLENNKIIEFQPLEDLKIIENNKETIITRDEIDINFKPGFYKQVESFLTNKTNLKTIEEQYSDCINIYDKISNYKTPYNVMIVGMGNIGFRHLQAIVGTNMNISLHLVEINEYNINSCESYLKNNNISEYKVYSNIKEINNVSTFDIIILSTCSNIRLKLIEDISNNSSIEKINNLVLEKIIFTNYDYFNEMENLLSDKINLKNIYCSSDWYNRFNFKEISQKINLSKSKIHIKGNNWGLGCNSIHGIMCLLKIFDNFELKTKDIKIVDAKRDGFKELKGIFYNDNIIIEDTENEDSILSIEIKTENNKILIKQNKNKLLFTEYINNIEQEYEINEQYLSEYYINEYKSMLYSEQVNLVNYKTSKLGHKILISTLNIIFKDYDNLPIT
jgi:predicted dehydrogenase